MAVGLSARPSFEEPLRLLHQPAAEHPIHALVDAPQEILGRSSQAKGRGKIGGHPRFPGDALLCLGPSRQAQHLDGADHPARVLAVDFFVAAGSRSASSWRSASSGTAFNSARNARLAGGASANPSSRALK